MKATMPEPEIVMRKGKPVSVIIPIKDYEELLERLEDTDDVAYSGVHFLDALPGHALRSALIELSPDRVRRR